MAGSASDINAVMEQHADNDGDYRDVCRMFTAEDVPLIVSIFNEFDTDQSRGLSIEEFCRAMQFINPSVNTEEVLALHMKIDTNCDEIVDIGELLDYLICKNVMEENLAFIQNIFPLPFKTVPGGSIYPIVRLICLPLENKSTNDHRPQLHDDERSYEKCQYLSITSSSELKLWSDTFDTLYTWTLQETEAKVPLKHYRKAQVSDMVYIRELNQLAISTGKREVQFYSCDQISEKFQMSYAVIEEDNRVTCLNYWSDGIKGVLSFGDAKGQLTMFISNNMKENQSLFDPKLFETIIVYPYPTAYVSKLLSNSSTDFTSHQISLFSDTCFSIKYFASLESFIICGESSKTMVCVELNPVDTTSTLSKKVFSSPEPYRFFTCAEYSNWSECYVTGGTDGTLRVWNSYDTSTLRHRLNGHVNPITHVMYNPKLKLFISISTDLNVRLWSDGNWQSGQSFYPESMQKNPITCAAWNIYNNELFLANSDIGKCLGVGTDVFKSMLTSHMKPLCCVLYHSIFNEVISVCEEGRLTQWDVRTGKALMKFAVNYGLGHTNISFDEPQRRLISIAQDQKVRLWNFNNGQELNVFPVKVPYWVTGMICRNGRLFVSGLDSNFIFDLDIKKLKDNRYWSHPLLVDVCGMKLHRDTLIAASSNGNIVVLDVDTFRVIYYMSSRENHKTVVAGPKNQGSITHKGKTTPMQDAKVNFQMVCLNTRMVAVKTATLLTTSDGYICAWSVIASGGLMSKFRAVKDDGSIITFMSTDAREKLLLTGDSNGEVCVWDIQNFGFKDKDNGPYEYLGRCHVSVSPPPLLNTWQAHLGGLVGVLSDHTCENIVTAGLDCNVKLWTITGGYVGTFGKDTWIPHWSEESNQPEMDSCPMLKEPLEAQDSPVPKTPQLPECATEEKMLYLEALIPGEGPDTEEIRRLYVRLKETEKLCVETMRKNRQLIKELKEDEVINVRCENFIKSALETLKSLSRSPRGKKKRLFKCLSDALLSYTSYLDRLPGGRLYTGSSPRKITAGHTEAWRRTPHLVLTPSQKQPSKEKQRFKCRSVVRPAHISYMVPPPDQTHHTSGSLTDHISSMMDYADEQVGKQAETTATVITSPNNDMVHEIQTEAQLKVRSTTTQSTAEDTGHKESKDTTEQAILSPVTEKAELTQNQTQHVPQLPSPKPFSDFVHALIQKKHNEGGKKTKKQVIVPQAPVKVQLNQNQDKLSLSPQLPSITPTTDVSGAVRRILKEHKPLKEKGAKIIKPVILPQVPDKAQLTKNQTKQKPNVSLTQRKTGYTGTMKRTDKKDNTVKQGSKTTQLKSHPPTTKRSTEGTGPVKSMYKRDNEVRQEDEETTQLTPHPPTTQQTTTAPGALMSILKHEAPKEEGGKTTKHVVLKTTPPTPNYLQPNAQQTK